MTERELLTIFLDKFERSKAFRENIPVEYQRRLLLTLFKGGRSHLIEYNIENADMKESFEKAVFSLAEKGVVQYQWLDHHCYLLKEIWIEPEDIEKAYRLLGRVRPETKIGQAIREIDSTILSVREDWVISYLEELKEDILEKRNLRKVLPLPESDFPAFLHMLKILGSKTEEEVLENVFSVRCFNDSKVFRQRMKRPLVRALRKSFGIDEEMRESEWLELVGIRTYPERFEIMGEANLGELDLMKLRREIAFSPEDLSQLKLHQKPVSLLSVENKANFVSLCMKGPQPGQLILYHAGQYSPAKKRLLQTLQNQLPEGTTWRHWGDIDYGGFCMLRRLRREISPQIMPYHMDVETLEKYETKLVPHETYLKKLKSLLDDPLLQDCRETISYMIDHAVILEQESILVDPDALE